MSSHLIIVESPTKAKTIAKFLGKDYRVLSSFGHVRDLPKSKTGVDVKHHFKPTYQVPPEKQARVDDLIAAASKADDIILATDEDREGEAIAWHVAEVLEIDPETAKRITFHEITKPAIEAALAHPRTLDMNMVHAQQSRRILDRLVGYELSPLLWAKIRRGLSAGRVQSVAVRLVVERERERQAFKIDEYWTVEAALSKDGTLIETKLMMIGDRKLDKLAIRTEAEAKAIEAAVQDAKFRVIAIEKKDLTKAPPTPFTTSALQIESNNQLGYQAKQTMGLAQKLYETGRITYMRTDSVNLAEAFLEETQKYISATFGAKFATGIKRYKTKAKGAQEAHEAIRPTDPHTTPESLKGELDSQMWRLYDLIWRRTVASQLPSAVLERTSVDVEANNHTFRGNGHTVKVEGFMKVYRATTEKLLPMLAIGDVLKKETLAALQHFTEPPARYSDATLVKTLEELGIGRPSTYAPTIATIEARGYVERDDNKKLFPIDIAYTVTDLLTAHFPSIVDYAFTAKMEKNLDDVAETGKWVPMLEEFYTDFHKTIESNTKNLKREDFVTERDLGPDPKTGLHVFVRSGRFGPFVTLGELPDKKDKEAPKPRRASVPKDMLSDDVTLEKALYLLILPRIVGTMDNGDEILASLGRFGPYLKAGEATVSLEKPLDPRTISEADAKRLLSESIERKRIAAIPIKELGTDTISGAKMMIRTGRFGPYVTDGITNASLGKKLAVEDVTDAIASELLEKKRHAPKRNWNKRKTTTPE